ncbi:MAG TPA: hypothetical protein VJO33_17355 [Gemmatimonadaceae bacterium]|nr:hypothetical protein [Gemmatimonadaceae bacterium]
MNAHDKRVSQSFRGVEVWVDAHTALIPPEAAGQVEALRRVNQRLAQYVIDQEHQDRTGIGGTVTVQQLRQELWQNHLVPIAAMARSVVPITPELAVALRVPRPTVDVEKVLASANAIAKIGDANREVLVQHGLPTNFVEELRAGAATLQAAMEERRKVKSSRVGATKGIATELKTGRLVVQTLDIVFTRVLRAQPGLLAEWRNTKRVTIKPVRPASAPDVAPTPSEQKAA